MLATYFLKTSLGKETSDSQSQLSYFFYDEILPKFCGQVIQICGTTLFCVSLNNPKRLDKFQHIISGKDWKLLKIRRTLLSYWQPWFTDKNLPVVTIVPLHITRLLGNKRALMGYGCWLVIITNQQPYHLYTLLLPTSLVMVKGTDYITSLGGNNISIWTEIISHSLAEKKCNKSETQFSVLLAFYQKQLKIKSY